MIDLSKVEELIKEYGGIKINKITGIIMPEYLYRFSNNLWLSIVISEESVSVNLGRLFKVKDFIPKVIVLEDFNFYVNEKYNESIYLSIIYKELGVVLSYYEKLISDPKIKDLINKREEKLKEILIEDISDIKNLFSLLRDDKYIEGLNENARKQRKKSNKNEIKSMLLEGLLELLLLFFIMLVGLGLSYLFNKFGNYEDVSLEAWFLLGMVVVGSIIGIILGIVFIIQCRKK